MLCGKIKKKSKISNRERGNDVSNQEKKNIFNAINNLQLDYISVGQFGYHSTVPG